MLINRVNLIQVADVQRYAWSRIALFQNIEHTCETICQLHAISIGDKNSIVNAKRQAEQIKYCLLQAREYFDAAAVVSLATKPVLLYYAAMSIALAEILLKQDGNSRLARLRADHNCHGLTLTLSSEPKPENRLEDAASALIAKAQYDQQGNPRGTFEIWRRSAREYPLAGWRIIQYPNGTQQRHFSMLTYPVDEPPPMLKPAGITLLDCLCELPYLQELLVRLKSRSGTVRANMTASGPLTEQTTQLIVQPNPPELIEKFGQAVRVAPDSVNVLEFTDMPSGYIMRMPPNKQVSMTLPGAISLNDEDAYFSCGDLNLGEFGFLYAALHICGNFARYYPDVWLRHIDKCSPLAMAIDELCLCASDRLPLLLLTELLRTYHVLKK